MYSYANGVSTPMTTELSEPNEKGSLMTPAEASKYRASFPGVKKTKKSKPEVWEYWHCQVYNRAIQTNGAHGSSSTPFLWPWYVQQQRLRSHCALAIRLLYYVDDVCMCGLLCCCCRVSLYGMRRHFVHFVLSSSIELQLSKMYFICCIVDQSLLWPTLQQ